jgi:hypothetical protein
MTKDGVIGMPKYLISWEESVWYDVEIGAAFEQEALDKFHANEYDREDVITVGQEWIPDSIEVKKV